MEIVIPGLIGLSLGLGIWTLIRLEMLMQDTIAWDKALIFTLTHLKIKDPTNTTHEE
mgnify:CR=1 FL=1